MFNSNPDYTMMLWFEFQKKNIIIIILIMKYRLNNFKRHPTWIVKWITISRMLKTLLVLIKVSFHSTRVLINLFGLYLNIYINISSVNTHVHFAWLLLKFTLKNPVSRHQIQVRVRVCVPVTTTIQKTAHVRNSLTDAVMEITITT